MPVSFRRERGLISGETVRYVPVGNKRYRVTDLPAFCHHVSARQACVVSKPARMQGELQGSQTDYSIFRNGGHLPIVNTVPTDPLIKFETCGWDGLQVLSASIRGYGMARGRQVANTN